MKHTKIMNIFPVEAHWLLAIFWRRLKRDQSLSRTSEVADWGFTLWAEWEALCLETKEKPWKALPVIGFLPWAATLNPRRCTNCIPRIWTHPHCPIALDFTDSCGSLVWKCMEAGAPIVVPNHLQHFIRRYMKRHEKAWRQPKVAQSITCSACCRQQSARLDLSVLDWRCTLQCLSTSAETERGAHTCLCRKIKDVLMTVGPPTVAPTKNDPPFWISFLAFLGHRRLGNLLDMKTYETVTETRTFPRPRTPSGHLWVFGSK